MSTRSSIGVTGLAVMGRNLARNLARHGHTVAVHNCTERRTKDFMTRFGDEGTFLPAYTAREFVASLERPRQIVVMVKAGAATDAVIDEFAALLEPGDRKAVHRRRPRPGRTERHRTLDRPDRARPRRPDHRHR